MKQIGTLMLACTLALAGCARKAENTALREGTPAFALAQELAKISPALGPDRTTVLVETRRFVVTAADVIQAAWDNLGTRSSPLKSYDAGKLKQSLDRAATTYAERKLILAAAAAAKVTVTAEELDRAMQNEYAKAGSEQAFLDVLKGAEISIDNVKKSVEESLLINKHLSRVAENGPKVAEDELRRAYEQETAQDMTASVRHILILTEGKSEAEKAAARAKIEDLLAQAKAGADFAELARKYSEDPGSKDNGGLYENTPRGTWVKPFEDAAFSVPVGEISGVVETNFGYHIIKVIDRRKETRPFDELRAELESKLRQGKQATVVQDYVQGLKDKAKFKLIGL
jgi:parvulin-like peptidyl-prolyl isomerase